MPVSCVSVKSIQVEDVRYSVDPKTKQDFQRGVDLVGEVAKSCDMTGKLDIFLSSPYFHYIGWASVKKGHKACFLNPFVFLNVNNFCKEIRPKSLDDPQLRDPAYLQRLRSYTAQCVAKLSGQSCKTGKATKFDSAVLRLFIRARQDELKYEKMIRSLIGHELGHIHFVEAHREKKKSAKKRSILIRIGSLMKKIPVLMIRPIDKRLGFRSRRHERQADFFMIEKLGKEGLEGAKYGFEIAKQSFKEMRNDKSVRLHHRLVRKLMISSKGNYRPFTFTHRSFDARYKAMQRHLKKISAA